MPGTAVHFGGGNIGRGFVGEKLFLSGYETIYVDVMDKLIESLQSTKEYTVREIGEGEDKITTVKNYRAINSKTHEQDVIDEIAKAEIVTCAVGPKVMTFIAPVIAKAILKRTSSHPIAVIACENMVNATSQLEEHIKSAKNTDSSRLSDIDKHAVFANSAIDRIVPGQAADAGLNVTIESFFEWCVEETPFVKAGVKHPKIEGVHWVEDLQPYIERKLYTVNTSHAAAAYYGHARGKKYVHEAMEDKEIHDIVRSCVKETADLITNKHEISKEDQDQYVETIIKRISNPYLADVVERVGRAPLRKLGRKERFVGPAAELAHEGRNVDALLGAIEQAFKFQNVEGDEESVELAQILKEHKGKPKEVVEKICGLTSSDKLFEPVVKIVEKING